MLLEGFINVLKDPIYIVSIILAAVGIACALIAKRVTKLVRKTDNVDPSDKLLLLIKVTGLGLILIGLLLLIVGGVSKL